MAEWTYFAGGIVGLEETFDLIQRLGIVWRPTRARAREGRGARIANVRHLRPGDLVHFVYRAGGEARYLFSARIDEPLSEVPGAPAFDRVVGEVAAELRALGYPGDGEGGMEVLRISGFQEVPGWPSVEPPGGRNTLWSGPPRLSGAASRTTGEESRRRPRRSPPRRARPALAAAGSPLRHAPSLGRAAAFFDRYLAVDWSANSIPKEGADSIWIGEGGWEATVTGARRSRSTVRRGTRRSPTSETASLHPAAYSSGSISPSATRRDSRAGCPATARRGSVSPVTSGDTSATLRATRTIAVKLPLRSIGESAAVRGRSGAATPLPRRPI